MKRYAIVFSFQNKTFDHFVCSVTVWLSLGNLTDLVREYSVMVKRNQQAANDGLLKVLSPRPLQLLWPNITLLLPLLPK